MSVGRLSCRLHIAGAFTNYQRSRRHAAARCTFILSVSHSHVFFILAPVCGAAGRLFYFSLGAHTHTTICQWLYLWVRVSEWASPNLPPHAPRLREGDRHLSRRRSQRSSFWRGPIDFASASTHTNAKSHFWTFYIFLRETTKLSVCFLSGFWQAEREWCKMKNMLPVLWMGLWKVDKNIFSCNNNLHNI